MECSGCSFRVYTQAESNEMECAAFGDDIPDDYMRKDGEGCICNTRQIKKIIRENNEAWCEEAGRFAEWLERRSLCQMQNL